MTEAAPAEPVTPPPLVPCTLGELLRYFLWLGATGFGGPIALCGYMQRDLVEERRWFSAEDYKQGLALSQLAPGPLAAQLAIYLGWVRGGTVGAALTGLAFVVPSFLMVFAIAALYMRYGGLSWISGLFYGVGAAVIAVIARSAYKLARLTNGRDRLLWAIFLASALITAITESEVVWVFLGAGLLVLLVRARPTAPPPGAALGVAPLGEWFVTGLHGPATPSALVDLLWFFTKAGAFVFGSGLAIVPFMHAGVVEEHRWLNEQQFLDAVAVAMITPGPVVITVAFIGYLAAGPVGAALACVGVFLPCWLFTVIPAPYFKRWGDNRHIKAFVDGVTAGAAGAIGGAAWVLGTRAIVDVPTALIAAATLAIIIATKKVPEPLVILGAGLVGIGIKALG